MPTDMPRCETCRHWHLFDTSEMRALKDERWGQCRAGHEMIIVETYTLAQGGDLDTRFDFGCIAHEPKEG